MVTGQLVSWYPIKGIESEKLARRRAIIWLLLYPIKGIESVWFETYLCSKHKYPIKGIERHLDRLLVFFFAKCIP